MDLLTRYKLERMMENQEKRFNDYGFDMLSERTHAFLEHETVIKCDDDLDRHGLRLALRRAFLLRYTAEDLHRMYEDEIPTPYDEKLHPLKNFKVVYMTPDGQISRYGSSFGPQKKRFVIWNAFFWWWFRSEVMPHISNGAIFSTLGLGNRGVIAPYEFRSTLSDFVKAVLDSWKRKIPVENYPDLLTHNGFMQGSTSEKFPYDGYFVPLTGELRYEDSFSHIYIPKWVYAEWVGDVLVDWVEEKIRIRKLNKNAEKKNYKRNH